MQTFPDMPLVSIVMAVYNGEKTIGRAVESITNQDYPNKELIVIDGASNDATLTILEKWEAKLAYWESKKDRGIYHAWNKGVAAANGDYICFIGCDDRYAEKSSLSQMMSLIQNGERPELISAKFTLVSDKGEDILTMGEPWDWHKLKKRNSLAHPGMLHKATLFKQLGNYDERYKICADYDFILRIGSDISSKFLNKVTILMGDGGVSNTFIKQVLNETRLIQSRNPQLGTIVSLVNFAEAHMRTALSNFRALLGIRSFKFW